MRNCVAQCGIVGNCSQKFWAFGVAEVLDRFQIEEVVHGVRRQCEIQWFMVK